ncbi:SusC/RagA family TonB-linked outer membrane protein [Sphingobacterium chuzhouense]|uniref:SusC/RagA family TonB-linked outer membrane protein n=1 Tax=Sphingobacterium chuzhouense TaxID=1742264 RepID=A0ABR7XMS3_9SPHI|nr:SusC/RagA family TonB-linked outer membrane protein [Sphingobacterium chuzhouense]MBD1420475.1 SusC/RagA family TonB-linked outer membrane protein [Sphingobacterium chuzhouense]
MNRILAEYMTNIKKRGMWRSLLLTVLVCGVGQAFAQTTITGKVVSNYDKSPISDAVVTVLNTTSNVRTKKDGSFTLNDVEDGATTIRVWSPGYYESYVEILGRNTFEITLIGEGRTNYINIVEGTFSDNNNGVLSNNDYRDGAVDIEQVLTGEMTGLRVLNKSGMVTEGGMLNFRGVRSFDAENTPLIVVDGVPYLPDLGNSPIIGGYSRGMLAPFALNDIKHIRLLKGAETARYGSLGSNGVLLLETSSSDDLETVVEFRGNYGIAHNYSKIPMLGTSEYKRLLGEVGMTQYEDMGDLLTRFPFLRDDPNYYYNFQYNNATDWQDVIYRNAFVTDNHLRIKGGDAVAKYDLSLGVLSQQGTLDQTTSTRYSTRLNSSINLGGKFDLKAITALTYSTSRMQEQGILHATNPLLAALFRAPILSPYRKDVENNILPELDGVGQFGVSNPVALLQTADFKSDIYDVFVQANLGYQASDRFRVNAMLGLFSNYTRQSSFIPGLSSRTILPLEEGIALNTARAGAGQASNISWNLYGTYQKQWDRDDAFFGGGVQGLLTTQEYDAGSGRNTSSDFYRTLNYVNNDGRLFWGYNEQWNWMNIYGYTQYNWRSLAKLDVNLSIDGSSVSGANANRFGFFPAADLSFLLSNTALLKDINSVDNLVFKIGYAKTGNSRFLSKIGQAYYGSQLYRQLAGIIVGNIPNEGIRWEDNENWQANLIFSGINQRLNVNVGYYFNRASNLLNAFPVSPIGGIDRIYMNGGAIHNQGLEVEMNVAVIDNRDWSLTWRGNLSTLNSKVKNLVGGADMLYQQENGVTRINRIGESPFSFYGAHFLGVISSDAQATSLGLQDYKNRSFIAGDAHFDDINQDGVIDNEDQVLLGNSLPNLFGGTSLSIRYKNIHLQGLLSFSKGNQMYNGLRRSMESMDSYANQSEAVLRRWQTDGQLTNIPQATYGDPMENARFSNRWIEDASFLRLENITLSYKFGQHRLNVLSNSEWYIVGENLFTWTDYLGLDPVTAYSNTISYMGADYGKIPLPRTFKLGVNIKL